MSFLAGLVKAMLERSGSGAEKVLSPLPAAHPTGESLPKPGSIDPGNLPAALAEARARIGADPRNAEAWLACASTLMRWGRRFEALDAFRNAWELDRRLSPAALGLGVAAWEAGQRDDAERSLKDAIGLHPDSLDLVLALAQMLVAAGRVAEARDLADRARAMEPTNATALVLLARCDRLEGNDAAAEDRLREAARNDGSVPATWEALASVLGSRGKLDDAHAALTRAQELADASGVDLDTSLARADLLRLRSDFAGAAQVLSRALARRPNAAESFMLAEMLIVSGQFASGWRHYEFRRFNAKVLAERPRYGKPEWTGQELAGRTILVEAEQGIGDVVWFARYFPMLKQLGARVVFLPRIDMVDVSRRFAGIDQVLADGDPLPAFDYHVKLMSLASRFGTTLKTIPRQVPYFAPDRAYADRWSKRLNGDGPPRIGIVWAGKPAQPRDRFRSLNLAQLLPILRVPGLRFHSLQKGPAEAQLADLPADVRIAPLGAEFDDLDDLVAAIGEMDLVISACTAPAHIAGAMGKPVWTMICEPPDLRWLVGREDSPWYPSMRLFRQRASGRWDDVVERVAAELARGPQAWNELGSIAGTSASHANAGMEALPDDAGDTAPDADTARLVETKHGLLMFDPLDARVGPSLERRGEWSSEQLDMALRLLLPGSWIIEAGAGVGAHALALGRALGASGQLLVYEGRERIGRMLRQNLDVNGIVRAVPMSRTLVGTMAGRSSATHETIDDLQLQRLDGLKVNLPESAETVIEGAGESLWRCRPWLLLAVNDDSALERLAARVREFGYRCWRLDARHDGADRVGRRDDDGVDGPTAVALVALPEEADLREPLHGCVELH